MGIADSNNLLKTFGISSIILTVFAGICAIVGLVVATASLPATTPRCPFIGDKKNIDDFNTIIGILGLILTAVGIVTTIGSSIGICGCLTKSKCGLISTSIILTIGVALSAIVAFLTMAWTAGIKDECDKRVCNALTYQCHKPGCNPFTGDNCSGWCKDHYDYFCEDLLGKLGLSFIVFLITTLIGIPVSGCSCGAACCCKQSFGTDPAAMPAGAPPAVVGQVVGNA